MKTAVIIPAYNEEKSIGSVINDIPKERVSEIIVVNNGSTDRTAEFGEKAGATVLHESLMGYGAACLKGINYLEGKGFELVVFLDGDFSDYPDEIDLLTDPIISGEYDFVLGSRVMGKREKDALPLQSRIGSVIAGFFINLFWHVRFTDLGPFRVIKYDKLIELDMKDKWFGWTIEMQIKAAKKNYKIMEVPVRYRKRIGKSKVTGTIKGSFMAGVIILKTIFVQLFKDKY
ncbi:MAG: glycosyltransferase family 2 protein [Ignavibacteriaceae bacterium]|nr:glycosyltransferase family 2 protein [Ignavibacteriaceae bacterium]